MAKFIRLRHRAGEPIYVNPEHVMSVALVFVERDNGQECGTAVTTNRGTIITSERCEDVVQKLEGCTK